MKCPKCGKRLIQESLSPDGKTKKVRCTECDYHEVQDQRGCRLLTEVPDHHEAPLLG